MDVLVLLAANASQIVPKEALFAGAWREVAVGDNSIAQAITGLRKALGTPQRTSIEKAVLLEPPRSQAQRQ